MSGRPLRVLVVDDVLEYADMIVEFVRTSGAWEAVETATAGSYEQAVRALTTTPYDIAFVDYRLGARDGVALLREVRANGVATPVVILTGYGDEHVAVEAMKAGAADYLGKMQVTVDALERTIRHALALGAEEQQRRQAEAALRGSERRFRALVENSSDALLLIDADGRIRYATSSAERHLGWPSERMCDRSLLEFVHSDDQAAVTAQLADRLTTPGATATLELQFRHPDGRFRIMELVMANRFDEPAVNAIIVNARDMTERRRLEDRLQHAQKMEAVGQLAGGVAHDFNNLLTVILGYTNLMLEDVPQGDPLRQDLGEVRSAGERALLLTRQLLAFGRRQMLQPQIVDLNALIRQLERLLRRLVTPQIELVTILAPQLPPVRVDPSSMEQVLVNLAANARDAMPVGGRVTIETANADLAPTASPDGAMEAGSYVVLTVHDTGPAIDEAARARIFEPFFATREHSKTDGLGLATVYGIVKQSGGYIWADGGGDGGTTFKICLPAASAAAAPEPAREPEGRQSWETVLLVQDEAALRALTREVLRRQGYTVLEARHGVDALRLAERHHDEIHLLIADLGMSRISGRELAERLMSARPGMKLLLLIGAGDTGVTAREAEIGAATLRKPFTPDALVRTVRAVLDRTDRSHVTQG